MIYYNIIIDNSANMNGGGIYCEGSQPIISSNSICGNSAIYGGGIQCSFSNTLIRSNIIIGNEAFSPIVDGLGGGIYLYNSDPIIIGNTISDNLASSIGGGICCGYSSPIITNTISWADTAFEEGFEIYAFGTSSPVIRYCNIQGGWPGEGNIDVDPLFRDPENDDFHLMATYCGDPYDSPCIDAGHPDSLDILLDCFHGLGTERADMGTYGGNNADWPTGIEGDENKDIIIPEDFLLYQNYPNPFNASTVIRYSLPIKSDVQLDIYNLLGQRVVTLFEGIQQAGEHSITWNATDLPSGVYFARLESGEHSETIKMVLVK